MYMWCICVYVAVCMYVYVCIGVTLYAMTYSQLPYRADTPQKLLQLITHTPLHIPTHPIRSIHLVTLITKLYALVYTISYTHTYTTYSLSFLAVFSVYVCSRQRAIVKERLRVMHSNTYTYTHTKTHTYNTYKHIQDSIEIPKQHQISNVHCCV